MLKVSRRKFGALALTAPMALIPDKGWTGEETLTVGVVSDPVTLDPALMASFFEISVQFNIHEPLVHMTPDLNIETGLAMFEVQDPLTYSFRLKPDLSFHDGIAIDAAAAKFNLDRMRNPSTASPRRMELEPIQSIEVTGKLDFIIRLKQPYQPLLQVLALRAGMLVSPDALERLGANFASQAVGAGPYKVVSWIKNSELVVERFDDYWRGKSPIRRIVFRPISDETIRLTNLRSGTVQLIDAVPPQLVKSAEADTSLTIKQMPGLGFNAFSFNMTRRPFNDIRVRRAFAAAIDRNSILRAVNFGTGTIAYGPIPPAQSWAYDGGFKPQEFDAALAKQLIEQVSIDVPVPVPVTVTVTNSPSQVRTAEILQAECGKAGFDVKVRQIDSSSLITVLRQRDFDVCFSPWSGRSDPDGNMFGWFTPSGSFNFAGYENDEVADLLRKGRSASSKDERASIYRRAQAKIAADLPMLFLTFPATIQASRRELNWNQNPDGAFRLNFASFRQR
jgi:peptide/nickel transport system substrate-binding protein